ncbi:MAG TPA: putative baseplate assembly protein [Roseiflexaceae bacterium]|nr:putative baseplate assembly protein [Roseiflexaceae bacterium]
MALPTPNLDDRRFQDIVDEAKRLIPRYCPEWTDHNVSDPGVTLIELFAWMTEMLIYRLNQVPDKNFITFMELIGTRLQPPAAASTELTFWLSSPPAIPISVPAGTQAATMQTAAEASVEFRTDDELIVFPPELRFCLTTGDERVFEDQTWTLGPEDEAFLAFGAEPRPGNAFYIGFAANISRNILSLNLDCTIEGIGVDPSNPPLVWEAWQNDGWVDLELERDETGGFNKPGRVILYMSPRMARQDVAGKSGFWIRCRHTPPEPGQPTYSASPQIRAMTADTLGGMVSATHATMISDEILGRSSGRPGQQFYLEHAPVLPRRPGESIMIREHEDGPWEAWIEVGDFSKSGRQDMHYVLDSVSGEIMFGPSIREPDGYERQYGAIPARNGLIRFSRYRSGGGAAGNVGAGTITRLRSAVPYVDRVINRRRAEGGLDAETLDRARLRAPQMLRSRDRAVTAEDYEFLAREASSRVARAFCLQPRALDQAGAPSPGVVTISLVPFVNRPDEDIPADQLRGAPDVVQDVQGYLDERRLLTTVVRIEPPEYIRVSVTASIKARPMASLETVRRDALDRLFRFLNPLIGGEHGDGWPFGRDLYISEIYTVLQGTPGIGYIDQVSMAIEGDQQPQTRISVPPNGLIVSAEHRVSVE